MPIGRDDIPEIQVGKQYPGQRVDHVLLGLAIDKDGNEGIAGFMSPSGWMPLMASTPGAEQAIREAAKEIKRMVGRDGGRLVFRRMTPAGDDEPVS